MDKDTDRLPIDDSLAIKSRVYAVLEEKGMSAAELLRRIRMTSGGFSKMWNNGTLTTGRLMAMAKVLNATPAKLLPGYEEPNGVSTIVSEPAGPAYGRHRFLEERVTDLETEVRKLKEQIRRR